MELILQMNAEEAISDKERTLRHAESLKATQQEGAEVSRAITGTWHGCASAQPVEHNAGTNAEGTTPT